LRKRHGWSPESKMPARYVHMVNADVDDAIFKQLGIKKQEEIQNIPKKCHICDMPNASDAKMCSKCGKPLDLKTVIENEERNQAEKQNLLKEVENLREDNAEIKEKFVEFKKEASVIIDWIEKQRDKKE